MHFLYSATPVIFDFLPFSFLLCLFLFHFPVLIFLLPPSSLPSSFYLSLPPSFSFSLPPPPPSLQSKNHSLPPVSLQGQVLWREFFYTVASATPNFTKMAGNPICLQIGWHEKEEELHKWSMVRTISDIFHSQLHTFPMSVFTRTQ